MGRRKKPSLANGMIAKKTLDPNMPFEKLARKFWSGEEGDAFNIRVEKAHHSAYNKAYLHMKAVVKDGEAWSFAMVETDYTLMVQSGLKVSGLRGYGVNKNVGTQIEIALNELFGTHMMYCNYRAVVDYENEFEIYILENDKPKYNLGDNWIDL